jgi:RND family efflux transporter MFP subunit
MTRAVFSGLFTLGLTSCTPAESAPEYDAVDSTAELVPTVKVVNVEANRLMLHSFDDYIRVTGEVKAFNDITVATEESGVIEEYLVDKGAHVEQGQGLARLKSDILKSQLAEAQANADLAKEQYERQKTLWQKDKIGSELAYLQAKTASDGAEARLATLKIRLKNTVVRAPVSGIFEEKYVDVGEMAALGTPVLRVLDIDKLIIKGGVPERYALAISPGDSATITMDLFPDQSFTGEISYVGGSVNPGNRTFPVEIELNNPGRNIKPSMIANVRMVRERLEDVIIVPRHVVQRTQNGYQLYLAKENDGRLVAVARAVEIGPARRNEIVIQSGLLPGELLITLGYQQLDEGSPIRILNTAVTMVDGESN